MNLERNNTFLNKEAQPRIHSHAANTKTQKSNYTFIIQKNEETFQKIKGLHPVEICHLRGKCHETNLAFTDNNKGLEIC